jgi:hypothetical protein
MILEGNQRGGAKQMAAHLLNAKDNEHVEVYEVSGFVSDNVHGALREIDGLSRGTQCRQFMFSLSLNPPRTETVPVEYFEKAIDDAEKKLGLIGQPRVVVFHEKEGRRHAHCIWSRINADEMKAINLPHYKLKLQDISKQLYLQYGWDLPKGFIDKQYRDPTNFSREEWQQAKRAKEDPEIIKALFKKAWEVSDSSNAFAQAIAEYGFTLARGDRRGYVAVDYKGEVYSLSRWADVKPKQIKERLGELDKLPSVDQAKAEIAKRMTDVLQTYIADIKQQSQQKFQPLRQSVLTMRDKHRLERERLKNEQEERWKLEQQKRMARVPRGFTGIWHRITGTYQKVRDRNERETARCTTRDRDEKQALITRQLQERVVIQEKVQILKREHREAMLNIRLDIGRYMEMQGHTKAPDLTNAFNRASHRKERQGPDFGPEM